jgi:hypothetical protein
MPSDGIFGFNWNGLQITRTPGGHRSSDNAFSSRRFPMKHQGQITSETTSIVRSVEELGAEDDRLSSERAFAGVQESPVQ